MIIAEDAAADLSRFNEMYGHAEILRQFIGVEDRRLRLVGQVQHGWSTGACVNPLPKPIYVWNARSLAGLQAVGCTDAVAIGAPYLYLPAPPRQVELGRSAKSLLAVPEHSTPGYPYADAYAFWSSYALWLEQVRREADLEQTTVCLHINDYDDPAVCHVLMRHGHTVACCGASSTARTTFLDRMRAFILQHGIVTSNAVGSALIYAAYEGKPVFVGGPSPERSPVDAAVTEVWSQRAHDPAWIEREFPGLRVPILSAAPHRDAGRRELGFDYKLSRDALWSLLRFVYLP